MTMLYGRHPFEGVEGKTLVGVAVSDGEDYLALAFEDGTTHYVGTDADCCSETWWADVLGARGCYGGKITGCVSLDLPGPDDDDERSRQESDLQYGYALLTTRGVVTFVFRNSSNGYYGGDALFMDGPPDGNIEWRSITTNDWRA